MVVIVDDDASFRCSLRDLFESAGLSTLCFDSAEQFLESETRRDVACLIADIRMVGMSGLDLQSKLRGESSQIPIVFITAHGDAETRILAMRDGAVGFLAKPFADTALLEIVHSVLQRPEDE